MDHLKWAVIQHFFQEHSIDVYGVVNAEAFINEPKGHRPTDFLESAKAVIVFGREHLKSTLICNENEPYALVRNSLTKAINDISIELCYMLEAEGVIALPIHAVGGSKYDDETQKSRGMLSLKYAAVLAGLGCIGKNTLVIHPKHGNLLWFGAVVINSALEASPVTMKQLCPTHCKLCIEACPVGAIAGDLKLFNQISCWNHAFDKSGTELEITCFECRKVCPFSHLSITTDLLKVGKNSC
ncbi:hypothetical protein [Fusibacter sp. 3D3]|uniref:hypothetical protein n=1 Tax=Fusibacter sp. 3D3 TaxID=1048380 RepID=UPI0008530634|nr:hypothetical protein [Fusibacter sp. 3D3]GAU79212.1 iron-sulfur cluster-binding protein [Fusibacter sp. 3D3]